jgi:YidC/Oxa1 family membrane protein insertase
VIAKPLSWVLHFFASIPLVNYGLAIILLTVLVRSAMTPLSRKAAKNAQMMQELAPEMKRIAEKYKNDMEKRAAAQRELFAKHNYNPFGGCLLMFIQLPIFIGLYRSLSVDIELLQAPLIPGLPWCSNLAGPDMLWNWESYLPAFLADPGTGWLGPYLNVLPIITIVLFLLQQKMFMPPATDEQTRMQQQMMKFMMIFMGVLFFRVPSGLCVYFIASSLWGIAERKLLPQPGKPGSGGPSAKAGTVASSAKANKASAASEAKKARIKSRQKKR